MDKMNTAPKFHPDVVNACKKYATANRNAGKAHWHRAERAHDIKAAAEMNGQHYVSAAMHLCGVARNVVVMDVKADDMRRKLKYQAKNLPPDSVSAFYELHLGFEIAMAAAGEDVQAIAAVEKKVKEIGKAIEDGAKVREVRRSFNEERKKQAALKRAARPVPEKKLVDPLVDHRDAEGMKALIEETCAPTGVAVPVVRIQPAEATPQAIKACLDDEKVRQFIATACPTRGNLWVLVDLTSDEKATAVNVNPEADKIVPAPSKTKGKKKGAA